MTTYKEIFGKYVRSVSSDPPAAAGEGEIWYNTTSNVFKSSVPVGAWSSGGALPAASTEQVGTGPQTSALMIGSETGLPVGVVLEYDGSSWTSGGTLNTARYGGGASGTQTSGLYFTGRTPSFSTATESYNGSAWTSVNAVNTAGFIVNGFGTQGAAVLTGGRPGAPGVASTRTEDWDGTNWTNGSAMAQARSGAGTAGTQTAGMVVGGSADSFIYYDSTQEYNGSSWTSVPGTISPGRRVQRGQVGSQTSALAFGGYNGSPPSQNAYVTNESYDGTTWTTAPSMANKRSSHGGTGASSSNGLAIGGYNGGSPISATEEFSVAVTVQTLTTS
jgi:hypothetical protein